MEIGGKVAVVTGGASGIGQAVVRAFVGKGGRVAGLAECLFFVSVGICGNTSVHPRFQIRNLHPRDEDLSLGTPGLGHPV